jgi:RND family efflux transporter MFP subunit
VRSQELAVQSLEIDLTQFGQDAEASIKTAEIELEKASDAYRKLAYPYSYKTFTIDVPEALESIRQAEFQLNDLKAKLAGGLDSDEEADAMLALMKALEDLVAARERLQIGSGSANIGDVSVSGSISVSTYWAIAAAQDTMEQAEVALNKLKNNVITGRQKVEVALESSKVSLESAQNRLDIASDELAKAELKAPFDGVVAQVPVKVGEVITSAYASTVIMKLVNPSRMEIEAKVDEVDVPGMKLGQPGIITVDALPDLEMTGEVTFVSLVSTQESGLVVYRVKVGFEVPEGTLLREGMTATVDIKTDESRDVLLVPDRAITQDSNGNPVVKVMVNDQIEERIVTLGLSDGVQTEIIQGLSEGDQVVEEIRVQAGSSLFGG